MEVHRIQPLEAEEHHQGQTRVKRGGGWQKWLLISLGGVGLIGVTVAVTLIVTGVLNVGKISGQVVTPVTKVVDKKEEASGGNVSDYWAVFLTNNQVYFGKLTGQDSEYLRLKDIFYLRAQRQLQPPTEEDERGNQPRQQIQLIKLGSELHGPVDEIQFNREQVLFIEKLKRDSRVVQGIEQFKVQSK